MIDTSCTTNKKTEKPMNQNKRCHWCDLKSETYTHYHDTEWGVPQRDDKKLFEMLLLETFQAGLTWITILKRREEFRLAFDNFDPNLISTYNENKQEELMQNKGIIRNRLKIKSATSNAKIYLEIQKEYTTFSNYLWSFTEGKIIHNTDDTLLASSDLSDKISADLKKRGMKFVGTVIIYAYLQAIGIVNDHELACFLHPNNASK